MSKRYENNYPWVRTICTHFSALERKVENKVNFKDKHQKKSTTHQIPTATHVIQKTNTSFIFSCQHVRYIFNMLTKSCLVEN